MLNEINTVLIDNNKKSDNGVWYEDDSELEEEEYPIDQYELTASPNDFNILTIYSFIESGVVRIPGFQRNYVWDLKRASKLIESLIIGLPVPQIFLYEESRNRFLVIDGQQRLMSVYYFIKQRFPRKDKRVKLRQIFEESGKITDEVLYDDRYFSNFNLTLPGKLPDQQNKFNGLNYSTLGEYYKTTLDLRTIRNVIVKQLEPKNDDSAIYEIFNRLNSGGINLTPQEIRMSLYHSDFMEMISRINVDKEWRRHIGLDEPDLHMKDIEILLRSFSMLIKGNEYTPSMTKFLNGFAKEMQKLPRKEISYYESLFNSFLTSCEGLPKNSFYSSANRFSITIFESVFTATCFELYLNRSLVSRKVDEVSLSQLKKDSKFISTSKGKTTNTKNVTGRLNRAKEIIKMK